MKTIKIGPKGWRNQVNETTVHEYPAGWSGDVSNDVARRAVAATVLDGEPVEAPEAAADDGDGEPGSPETTTEA